MEEFDAEIYDIVRQIPPGVLGIGHVHVRDDIHDAAVRLLRQALDRKSVV